MNGNVFWVEKENGKVIVRDEIDGKHVLQCLLHALKKGIELMEGKVGV